MLLVQFEDMGNSFFVLLFILFPIIYQFFYKPYFHRHDSVLWTVKIMEIILSSFSYVLLWTIPLIIFMLNPAFGFAQTFLILFQLVYIGLFFVFVILVVIDIFVYGWQFIFYVGGLGIEDTKTVKKLLKELNIKVKRK